MIINKSTAHKGRLADPPIAGDALFLEQSNHAWASMPGQCCEQRWHDDARRWRRCTDPAAWQLSHYASRGYCTVHAALKLRGWRS